MKEKNSWRTYIGNGVYYEFNNFKVYWAFMWSQAEQAESNIFKESKIGNSFFREKLDKGKIYSGKYKNSCK